MRSFFIYTLRRLLFQTIGWGIGLAFYAAIVISVFHIVLNNASEIQKLLESLPKSITSLAGDLSVFSTEEGYLKIRVFAMTPLILSIFAVIYGGGLLIQDEKTGYLDLFMGYPVKRKDIFLGKFAALILSIFLILIIAWLGIFIGLQFSVMKINPFILIYPLACVFALTVFFASLSLMLSMTLSSNTAAAMVSGLFMLISQVLSNLASLNPTFKAYCGHFPFRILSKYRCYLRISLGFFRDSCRCFCGFGFYFIFSIFAKRH